jgi:hypothetical protein
MSTLGQGLVGVALCVGLALSWMNACSGSEFGRAGGDGGGLDGDGGDESSGGSRDPGNATGGGDAGDESSGGSRDPGNATGGGDGTGDSGGENGGSGSGRENGSGGANAGASSQGGAGGGTSNQGGASIGQGGTSSGSGGTLGTGGSPSLCSDAAYFCDDFEDGDTVGWLLFDGSWSVVPDGTEVLKQASLDSGSAIVDVEWGAQDINVRVKLGEAPGQFSSYYALVAGRYQDVDNYYFVTIRADNKLGLGRRYQGSVTELISPVNINPAEWHSVRLLIIDSALVVYLDGVLRASVIDSILTTGGIALGSNGIAASFDDVFALQP